MNNPRCNLCGERHEPWDACPTGRREKILKKESKMNEKKQPQPRQRPEALKLHWKDGHVTMVAGRTFAETPLLEKIQPMYLAQGVNIASYVDAAEQLAFTLHGTTLNQLDDKTAEQVRHAARTTVNAALGIV
jgi:hypothetical protein